VERLIVEALHNLMQKKISILNLLYYNPFITI